MNINGDIDCCNFVTYCLQSRHSYQLRCSVKTFRSPITILLKIYDIHAFIATHDRIFFTFLSSPTPLHSKKAPIGGLQLFFYFFCWLYSTSKIESFYFPQTAILIQFSLLRVMLKKIKNDWVVIAFERKRGKAWLGLWSITVKMARAGIRKKLVTVVDDKIIDRICTAAYQLLSHF